VYCDPDLIPEQFSANLAELDFNDNVRWHDLKGTEHARPVITARDFVVATVAPPTKALEVAAEPGAAAAAPGAAAAAAPAGGARAPAAGGRAAPASGAKPAAGGTRPPGKKG
jgi:large subunit ribosomal protein L25